jgi:hypothetical protein
MTKGYATPLLLIEFDGDKAFALTGALTGTFVCVCVCVCVCVRARVCACVCSGGGGFGLAKCVQHVRHTRCPLALHPSTPPL